MGSQWYNKYRKLKVALDDDGYKLLMSQRDFKMNLNIYRLRECRHLNEAKSFQEFISLLRIMKDGGNVISNAKIQTPEGTHVTIPRYWIEKNSAVQVKNISNRGGDIDGINCISIDIPDEVKVFFKKRYESMVLDGY